MRIKEIILNESPLPNVNVNKSNMVKTIFGLHNVNCVNDTNNLMRFKHNATGTDIIINSDFNVIIASGTYNLKNTKKASNFDRALNYIIDECDRLGIMDQVVKIHLDI